MPKPSKIDPEIERNFAAFSKAWRKEEAAVSSVLAAKRPTFVRSYQRISSLHAWREYLLKDDISEGSLEFFIEAQNDALVSHVLAQHGSWRIALKALRSCIENVLSALYYKDHSVELELWARGTWLQNSELLEYFEKHPRIQGVSPELTGLATIKSEFATLSRAVHGSSKGFRMTKTGKHVHLWSSAQEALGPWATRERDALAGLNGLLLTLYRDRLTGAAHHGVREALRGVLPTSSLPKYKQAFGVSI